MTFMEIEVKHKKLKISKCGFWFGLYLILPGRTYQGAQQPPPARDKDRTHKVTIENRGCWNVPDRSGLKVCCRTGVLTPNWSILLGIGPVVFAFPCMSSVQAWPTCTNIKMHTTQKLKQYNTTGTSSSHPYCPVASCPAPTVSFMGLIRGSWSGQSCDNTSIRTNTCG